jgi:chromodomain-helicase-DNA-binding protein 1
MDMAHLEPIRWAMIAADNAHRRKIKGDELHRSLVGLSSSNRLLFTGTPLQYSVAELWALLHYCNPDQFDVPVAFDDSFSFSALGDEERVAELHSTSQPYIKRRQNDTC